MHQIAWICVLRNNRGYRDRARSRHLWNGNVSSRAREKYPIQHPGNCHCPRSEIVNSPKMRAQYTFCSRVRYISSVFCSTLFLHCPGILFHLFDLKSILNQHEINCSIYSVCWSLITCPGDGTALGFCRSSYYKSCESCK